MSNFVKPKKPVDSTAAPSVNMDWVLTILRRDEYTVRFHFSDQHWVDWVYKDERHAAQEYSRLTG